MKKTITFYITVSIGVLILGFLSGSVSTYFYYSTEISLKENIKADIVKYFNLPKRESGVLTNSLALEQKDIVELSVSPVIKAQHLDPCSALVLRRKIQDKLHTSAFSIFMEHIYDLEDPYARKDLETIITKAQITDSVNELMCR